MKKLIVLLFILQTSFFCQAQFYIGLNSGYSIGVNGRTMADFLLIDADLSGMDPNFIDNRTSFGGGLNVGTMFGYQINGYLGFELGVNYHRTNKSKGSVIYDPGDGWDASMKGSMLSLRPAIVTNIYKGNYTVFAKLGGVYNSGNFNFLYGNYSANSSDASTTKIYGGSALGVLFGAGVDWHLKSNWLLRTELNYISANYYPGKAELIKYEEDGQNLLPDIELKDRITKYSKTGISNGELYGAALQKGTVLRPQIPMNGLGLNVCLIYSFTKAKK